MASYIDVKFINICSSSLDKFKQKTTNLWNFRCPICGDSQKNKNKARGFIYEKQNKYFYRCHNCEFGTTFNNFLEKINPTLHREYITEKYKEKKIVTDDTSSSKFDFVPKFNNVLKGIPTIASLEKEHPARKFCEKRLIPEKYYTKLYFCTEFKEWTNKIIPKKFPSLKGDTPRLVIPFFDSKNNIIGFQGRSFNPREPMKYITIKLEGVGDLIYGQERINEKKKKYCVEGPLDSLFLPNCMAMAGVKFNVFDLETIIVLDNEKRNKEIVNSIEKFIKNGYKVCIWPEKIKEKDINDMILNGMTSREIIDIIDNNVYSGLQASFALSRWKKC
tara:strand:+ start:1977 stop:2972 length:996 start_codon:yes stop_codon:yes gene_type:complete